MNLIKPKKLQKGDKIGLLSVSGSICSAVKLEKAKIFFENEGYEVVLSDTCYKSFRYMAGEDIERVNALQEMFLDDSIKAIVAARGGYGSIRILDKIDYSIIKKHPKIFVGYSDITALLLMIYKKTGLVTFHGAMGVSDFGKEDVSDFTKNSFFNMLYEDFTDNEFRVLSPYKTFYNGVCDGILWGGNLSTICSMLGQDFIPDEKIVLFIEDLNESVYKIDRMLTQLLKLPDFRNKISGIAIGEFIGVDNKAYLADLFQEVANELKIPVCNGFKISHSKDKITIPVGLKTMFSADKGMLKLLESPFV